MTKEILVSDQVAAAYTNIESVLPPEPYIPPIPPELPPPIPPIPDPTGIALLLFAILAVSEGASRAIRGKS